MCPTRVLARLAEVRLETKAGTNKGAGGNQRNPDSENSASKGHLSSLAYPEGTMDETWQCVSELEFAPEAQPAKKVCSIRLCLPMTVGESLVQEKAKVLARN